MKLKYDTKVQSVAGSLTTSIPKTICDLLELEKGNTVRWEFDLETKTVTLKKLE